MFNLYDNNLKSNLYLYFILKFDYNYFIGFNFDGPKVKTFN